MQRVFIVGMYKSGTSWLLSALAKLPNTLALREIDILKAVTEHGRGSFRLRPPADRVEYVFGGTAWCGLPVDYLQPGVVDRFLPERDSKPRKARLGDLAPWQAIMVIRRMFVHRRHHGSASAPLVLREDGKPRAVSVGKGSGGASASEPVSFQALEVDQLVRLFGELRGAQSAEAAAECFVRAHEDAHPNARRIVMKGADQLVRFPILQQWQPDAKKILIVRDGRDVAISASHYRNLMSDRKMPWRDRARTRSRLATFTGLDLLLHAVGSDQFIRRMEMKSVLRHWSRRMREACRLAGQGELLLIRYEDLSQDFAGTFRRVLDYLGESMSGDQLAEIAAAVSFESQTGREQGEVKDNAIKRSGMALGWTSVLDERERRVAWKIAGSELAALGYTRDGVLAPFLIESEEAIQ